MSTPIPDYTLTMLNALRQYLLVPLTTPPDPPPDPAPPAPGVSLVSTAERSVGLGNRRGNETIGGMPLYALKGVQLEALVRFQIWGTTVEEVEAATEELQRRLRAQPDRLRADGFLRFAGDSMSMPESISPDGGAGFWRRAIQYRVLYEFRYRDADGALSLISRLRVRFPPEMNAERMNLTDDMTRWDGRSARRLILRGDSRRRSGVRELLVIAYLPAGWDGDEVNVETSVAGVNTLQTFGSVRALLNAPEVVVDDDALELGGNPYLVGHMAFSAPVVLRERSDFFRVRYATGALVPTPPPPGAPAPDPEEPDPNEPVVYLRALP
ncbi:MAG: hypothetical protein ABW250_08065 [Pyrinomonadaceae bacterium]